jgi:uncharacterized protein YjiS (DUF1127 family)
MPSRRSHARPFTALTNLHLLLKEWRKRRRWCQQLAELDDYLVKDVAFAGADFYCEVLKPF